MKKVHQTSMLLASVARSPLFDWTVQVLWYKLQLTISLRTGLQVKSDTLSVIQFHLTQVAQRHCIQQLQCSLPSSTCERVYRGSGPVWLASVVE